MLALDKAKGCAKATAEAGQGSQGDPISWRIAERWPKRVFP